MNTKEKLDYQKSNTWYFQEEIIRDFEELKEFEKIERERKKQLFK